MDSPPLWLQVTSSISAILAALAVVVTAGFVWRQMYLQNKSVSIDERRFLRESAQSVFDVLLASKFREEREIMLGVFRRGEELPQSGKERAAFRYVLNVYEMLATKVKLDAISSKPWKIYWGRTTLRDWERLAPFVTAERNTHSRTLYCDAEEVILDWKAEYE